MNNDDSIYIDKSVLYKYWHNIFSIKHNSHCYIDRKLYRLWSLKGITYYFGRDIIMWANSYNERHNK